MQRKIFSFLLAFAAVALLGSNASAQQKFTVNLNTIQEVPPTNTNGRGRCMVTLNLAQTQITEVSCQFDGLSSGVTQGHIHGPAAPGANAGILFDLTPPTGVTSGTFTRGPFNLTTEQLGFLRTKRLYVNIHTSNFPGGEIRGQIKIQTTPYDNDGDGRTDIKVYRPSNFTTYGIFSINNTIFSNVFGFADESPHHFGFLYGASDDYDGDGRGDLVLQRGSNGVLHWRISQTGSNTVRSLMWGLEDGDFPVPADYDGDGRTDVAVYRIPTGIWYILQSSNNTLRAERWGQAGFDFDFPVVGDFDGDGKSDLTVRRDPSDGPDTWITKRSRDNAMQTVQWGNFLDIHLISAQVDVDADGIQDRMVIRYGANDQMTFLVLRSSDNGHLIVQFGFGDDYPTVGDYDGDGRTDFVARRDINGIYTWFIALSSNNWNTAQPRVVQFGRRDDI